MSNELGDVSAGIGLDTSNFERGVRSVTAGMQRIVNSMRNSAGDVSRTAQSMAKSASDIDDAFKRLNIRSSLKIDADKRELLAAFGQIKASGTASLKDVQRASAALRNEMQKLNKEAAGASSGMLGFSGNIGDMVSKLSRATIAIAGVKMALSKLTGFLSDAVMAINQFEMGITAQAAIITSMQAQGNDPTFNLTEAYKQNAEYSRQTAAFLEKAAVETLASSANVQVMNNRLVLQGVLIDTTNEKAKQGFKNIANALQVMSWRSPNKPLQFDQEIRAMFDGQIRMSDQLAREVDAILERRGTGLKESLEKWYKEDPTGNLALEEIGDALAGFTAASGDIQALWTTVMSKMETFYNQVLRGGLTPFFTWLVEVLDDMLVWGEAHKEQIQTGLYRGWLAIKGVILYMKNIFGQNTAAMKVMAGVVLTILNGLGGIAYVFLPEIGKKIGAIVKVFGGLVTSVLSFIFLIVRAFEIIGQSIWAIGKAAARALTGDFDGAKEALNEMVSKDMRKGLMDNAKMFGDSMKDIGSGLNDAFNLKESADRLGDAAIEYGKVMKTPNAGARKPPYVQPFPEEDEEKKTLIDSRRNELAQLKQRIQEALNSEAATEFERAIERASGAMVRFKIRLEGDMKGKKPEVASQIREIINEVENLRTTAEAAAAVKFINKQLGEVEMRSAKAEAAIQEMSQGIGASALDKKVHDAAVGFERFSAKMRETISATEEFYANQGIPMPSQVAARLKALGDALEKGMVDARAQAIRQFTIEFDRDMEKYASDKRYEIELRLKVAGKADVERTIAEVYENARRKAEKGIGTENYNAALLEAQIVGMNAEATRIYANLANKLRDEADKTRREIELVATKTGIVRSSSPMGYDSDAYRKEMAIAEMTAAKQPEIDNLNRMISEAEILGGAEAVAVLKDKLHALYSEIGENAELKVKVDFDAEMFNVEDKIAKLTSFKSSLREFADSATGSLTDFFTTWMETGKMDFSELGRSLLQQLQIMAAQKTATLLMEAAYQGIMALVATASNNSAAAAKHLAAASAAGAGALAMGSFVAGSALAGMAHDGIGSIPQEGTWLLNKGERVVNDEDNRRLSAFLDAQEKGAGGVTINMPVTIKGGDEQSVMKALPQLRQTIIDTVNGNITAGGSIKKTIKAYAK